MVWPIVVVSLAMLLAVISLVIALFVGVPPAESGRIIEAMVKSQAIGKAIALFLIVPTIAVLSAMDKINGAAAIAALSAIAGYVLGGVGLEQAVR